MTAASAPRVRVEPHGPGRVLVVIARREPRAFALSNAEAARLTGDLARYLAELSGPDAAELVAELVAEVSAALGIERASAGLSGSVRVAAARPTRAPAPGLVRQRAAQRAAPAPRSEAHP